MIQDLTDTVASKVAAAFVEARHRAGIPAIGMVGTLVIVTGEAGHYDALRAAQEAAREHPARILVVIPRPGRGKARLDAEVRFLGDSGPGETGVLRLHGELADHAESVLLPLLLPDAPVIVWWPGQAPENPGKDPVGHLAQRRITDAAACSDPLEILATHRAGYEPGDTDLAWTRLTSWRTLLAATLDQPFEPITGAKVSCEAGSPSATLMAIWLRLTLKVPVEQEDSDGPGITEVRLRTTTGDIVLTRPDGRLAHLSRPGQPEREVALHQRDTVEIISEEMRRLDPDDVYADVLAQVGQPG
jgi:glucose-6-phosphate dehydrogenase assembly protein OpcA